MPPTTVLIADRHGPFRRSLRQLCEINGGFLVLGEAASAAEALAMARRLRPDALLMDMEMPGTDGAAVAQRLLAERPALVVVLLAFAWEEESLARARASGARAWLAKDCSQEALFAALRGGGP